MVFALIGELNAPSLNYILVDKQPRKWYAKRNIYVEVVDLSTPKSPNKDDLEDALGKALRIYRNCMRPFIVRHLRKVPGEKPEGLIARALSDQQADQFRATLTKGNDIESAIDFSYFPAIIQKNWLIEQNRQNYGFNQQFDADMTFQSRLWLIRGGRNIGEHEDTKIDSEFVRIHLFLIGEVLNKINEPDRQSEVEKIRADLFSDDTAERLAEAEERLKEMEAENEENKKNLAEVEKHLETVKSEKSKYETDNGTLSKQIDEKEKRRKKLSKQLKSARTQTDKYKKNLAGTKQRLEKSEAVQANYKEALDATTKKLEEAKRKCRASEDSLKATSGRLEDAIDEWMASVGRLTALQKLFTTAAIESQKVQAIFPPFETDSVVRILDRRGTDKRNYLSRLLDQKQPTIIYVQSEEKIDQLLTLVGPEKAAVIGKHSQQTSETEETEILKKLENRELIAAVSNTTFSELQRSDCVEHFVFCHLVPNVDEFFKRCQPAFASESEKDSYLHLIYESKQKIEELKQKYPKDELLRKLYQKIRNLTPIGKSINFQDLHSEICKENELDIAKLGFETGLVIFEELGLLKRNGETIERIGDVRTELNKSKTYCVGAELNKEIENSPSFQLEHSIELIWEKMLEALNVDSEQILRESSIHKMPLRVSETEGDYLKDSQTQPEQSTEVVEKNSAGSQATKGKIREKKLSIAERYTSETTEADRDELAVKIAKIRINATGSKPIAWSKIQEKFGLKNDQFHKVIRHSPGYRKAVIDRIQKLRARPEGWEYSGKLEFLTGIQISESELE